MSPNCFSPIRATSAYRMSDRLRYELLSVAPMDLGILPAELPARQGARRSICAAVDMKAGTKLNEDRIVYLRPGTGLAPSAYRDVLGKIINRDLRAGDQISRAMLSNTWLSVF